MADAYQQEGSVDRYLLEDGSGVYLLEGGVTAPIKQMHHYKTMHEAEE